MYKEQIYYIISNKYQIGSKNKLVYVKNIKNKIYGAYEFFLWSKFQLKLLTTLHMAS